MPEGQSLDLDRIRQQAREAELEYHEFLREGLFSAGLYRLQAGTRDAQTPHEEDEIYHVLSGSAQLEVAGDRRPMRAGSIAFVAKRVEHRFVDIEEDLEVLVYFAPPESGG